MAAKGAPAMMGPAAAAARGMELPAECDRRLAQFLRQVDETHMVWLDEIYQEAVRMFVSNYSEELELMPKTPSQKRRQRRKRLSALEEEEQEPSRKRLSRRRNSSKLVPSVRSSQRLQNKENLELSRAEAKENSPPQRVTRSRAAASARTSKVVPETAPAPQAAGKDPCLEANHVGTAVPFQRSSAKLAELLPMSSENGSPKEHSVPKSPLVPTSPELVLPCTPEASQAVPELQTAKAANVTMILSPAAGLEEGHGSPKEHDWAQEPSQPPRNSPGTPTGSRLSRRSVRRSLMGKTSLSRRTSLAEKYSLASKRESMIRTSITRAAGKKAAQKRSMSCSSVDAFSSISVPEDEETVVKTGPPPGPSTPSKLESPRMSLRSHTVSKHGQPQEPKSSENNSNKNGETLEPPQSARRKPSYKRAVDERYDHQQAEEGGLSPLRKKSPSSVFPASKVVRPFKTFLHTVQKNQLLMTPSSVGRNGVIKSFIRYNTPLQTDPKEKERQKLESLRKKQEAEHLRRQKLEEEKKRRLEETKLKREERLRKVLQARERAEEMEKERKKRIEQKIALFDEKTEKVREERLAEEKIKKKVAARKVEEAEARRRQEEEARRQRALQQEEEERRRRELMQKKKEEEQERARKMAEQRQAEQERERQLAAERELERKREQERIRAEKLREQQEKAARLQKEAVAAKERLRKEMEKEREQQMLEEKKRQEEEQKKLSEEQKAKENARAPLLENKENSPACNSYEMTPQSRKEFKVPVTSSNDYGMDLNSDDSTDDESQPRKPVPAWATGNQLSQAVIRQYYNPPDVDALFGAIPSPKLEHIFYKSKPRYFKRTSSAVWHSPPTVAAKPALGLPCSLKKP